MTVTFRIETELAASLERAFALSLDIGAHERSMAAELAAARGSDHA